MGLFWVNMTRRLLLLLLCVLAMGGAAAARAQPAGPATTSGAADAAPAKPSGVAPAEARHVIDMLQDPRQRAQLIETLRAIAQGAPPPPGEPAAAPATASEPAPAVALAPNGLGAQLLSQLSSWPEMLAGEAALTVRTITDLPRLWGWAERLVADPGERMAVLNEVWQVALVVAGALLLEWLARLVLARPIAALTAHVPKRERGTSAPEAASRAGNGGWNMLRRLPFAVARLVLDLIPIGVFWGAGSLFAGITPIPLTRSAILIVVNAYAANRVIMAVGGMLVSPAVGRLRLVRLDDEEANHLIRWLRRITAIAVLGGGLASLALLFGLDQGAYETLVRIIALIVAVLLGIPILRGRRTIALRLRAGLAAQGGVALWRNWLAGVWHYLAVIAIIAGWIVWAAGIRNGLGGLRLLVGSVAILVAARLIAIVVLGMLDRAAHLTPDLTERLPGAASRAAYYHAPTRVIARTLIVAATGVALLQFWGANAFAWFEPGRVGGRLVAALATIAIAAAAAVIVWEGANATLEVV